MYQTIPPEPQWALVEQGTKRVPRGSDQASHCCCPCNCQTASCICLLCLAITYVVLIPVVQSISRTLLYFGDEYSDAGSCTEFSFNAFDGGNLKGLTCDYGVQSQRRRPVIVLGGNGMDMYDSAQYMPIMLPRNESWQVFSMSMPGTQYAGGRPVETGPQEAVQEAQALLSYVWTKTEQPVTVFGWSLGSSLAAGLAASAPPEHVQCLMLGNPFTSFRALATKITFYLGGLYYFFLDDWPTAEWAAQVRAPTLVMSSLIDEVIPVSMHTEVYQRSGAAHKVLLEEQATHMAFRPFAAGASAFVKASCMPLSSR